MVSYNPTYSPSESEDILDADYEFLTPQDVQRELAIGKNTFYRLVRSSQLPAFRIGKLWRVRRTDLKNWEPPNMSFL